MPAAEPGAPEDLPYPRDPESLERAAFLDESVARSQALLPEEPVREQR